ncbi:MAG TPA: FCD domain-containing protein [Feifaniaceae bacterium]|nr:FCD domain-containing protein [Feifaniaceae bacterium]
MKQEGLKKSFVHDMQQKIFSGELQIGQQLPPERELAAQLDVSRSLVNTGIMELESQGFVRIMPRQGSVVADYKRNGTLQVLVALMNCDSYIIDYPLFCNMVDFRVLIECECARLACVHATGSDLDMLAALINRISNSTEPLGAVEPLVRFHYVITQISGNAVYAMSYKSFETVVTRLVNQHLSLAPDLPKTVRLHEALLSAISARDPEKSAQCMRLCLLQGMNTIKKLYRP